MASAKMVLIADSREESSHFVQRFSARTNKRSVLRNVHTYLNGLLGGVRRADVRVQIFDAFAVQTVTVSAATGAPNDTLVIGTITLTNKASPATEDEFADAATDTLLTASVVACINAHSILSLFVRATQTAATTFTITCLVPGPIGDAIKLAETGNGFTLTGTALDGGDQTVDESQHFAFGYDQTA